MTERDGIGGEDFARIPADAELRGRLAALNEVHEEYEFGDAETEEDFDNWLHEKIRETRKLLQSRKEGK